jgi:hypothetical protein
MSELKYKIKSLINELDPVLAKKKKELIIRQCQFSSSRFNNILNARINENTKLSFEEGLVIAAILNKHPIDLVNLKLKPFNKDE